MSQKTMFISSGFSCSSFIFCIFQLTIEGRAVAMLSNIFWNVVATNSIRLIAANHKHSAGTIL